MHRGETQNKGAGGKGVYHFGYWNPTGAAPPDGISESQPFYIHINLHNQSRHFYFVFT